MKKNFIPLWRRNKNNVWRQKALLYVGDLKRYRALSFVVQEIKVIYRDRELFFRYKQYLDVVSFAK